LNDWFSWNGVRCTEYGIRVSEQPPITIPAERATFTNVPGRSGNLTTLEGDDVYDDLVLTATCFIQDANRITEIAAWLKGSGTVTFANR
jgi:phage-related protein